MSTSTAISVPIPRPMDQDHVYGATGSGHVVAMPYPGRGHINPMMNLCRLLASRGLLVTVVLTEEWIGLLRSGPTPLPPLPSNLRLRSIPNVIPSEVGRATDFVGFLEAVYTKMDAPFERLLDRLAPPATGIVADTYLPWAVAVGRRRGLPVYSLYPMAASFFSVLYHADRLPISDDGQLRVPSSEEADEALEQYVPCLTSVRLSDIQSLLTMEKPWKLALGALSSAREAQGVLFTSFYELEPRVIDALQADLQCPVYSVGPSIPYMMLNEKPSNPLQNSSNDTDCYDWLDSQPKNSVLYISLGSFWSVSGPQMDEIAMGLRSSGSRFLWVARENASRMQEMSGDTGLVVPWCDQLRVLCHPAVGGFLTHCGWNSTLEAVFAGVPMLTFPIVWDQSLDSRLIVDEWKVGLSVKEEAGRKDLIGKEEIAEIVRRLMDLDGIEGREMRRRAVELREASRGAIEEDGSSNASLNSFIRDLMQGVDRKVVDV